MTPLSFSFRIFAFSLLLAFPTLGIAESPLTILKPVGNLGKCSVETWKQNWLGCEFEDGVKEGHLELVKTGDNMAWRIVCAPGGIGPEKGGVGWRWPLPKKSTRTCELRYALEFEQGFEFVKGGKLPGLCGGPKTITGGDTCTGYEGWSVRLMWRREGRGIAYVYHPNIASKYGDEFEFPTDFRFPVGQPFDVRLVVTMNSDHQRDGTLQVWVTLPGGKENAVLSKTDIEWTKDPTIGVDSILFNIFHGGNDRSWAPKEACSLRLWNISYDISP